MLLKGHLAKSTSQHRRKLPEHPDALFLGNASMQWHLLFALRGRVEKGSVSIDTVREGPNCRTSTGLLEKPYAH